MRPPQNLTVRGLDVLRRRLALGFAVLVVCTISLRAGGELTGELGTFEDRCNDLRNQGKFIEGQAVAKEFVARAHELHGEDHDATAIAVHNLAWFTQVNGDFESAEKLWKRALAIDERLHGKDSIESARRLNLLGAFYSDRGDFVRARDFLSRALKIREQKLGREHVLTGHVFRTLGLLLKRLGELEQAEECLRRAVSIFEKPEEPDIKLYLAVLLADLAQLYLDVGDPDKAEPLIERALKIDKQYPAECQSAIPFHLRLLAAVREARGELPQATALLEQSLAIMIDQMGTGRTNHEYVLEARQAVGQLYFELGDSAKVEAILNPTLKEEIDEPTIRWDQRESALLSLSLLNECAGAYSEAENLASRACVLTENLAGATQNNFVSGFRSLARVRLASGKIEAALSLADKIQELEEREIAEVLSFTSERQRLVWLQRFATTRYSLWATAGAVRPLARAVLRTKGLVVDSLLEDRLLAAQADNGKVREFIPQLQEARQRVVGLTSALAGSATNSSLVDRWTRELIAASSQVESLEAALARQLRGLGRGRRALQVKLEQVQHAIPEHSVVLEMVRYPRYLGRGKYEHEYGVLVLSRHDEPHWVRLGAAAAIDRAIKEYQHCLRNPANAGTFVPLLHELYSRLWQPIQSLVPAGTSLIISPDSDLNFISFATLLSPKGRFLGEDYELAYVSSARDLLDDTPEAEAAPELLVMANPDYGAPLARNPAATETFTANRVASVRALRDLTFLPLPGAEKEGKLLSQRGAEFGFSRVALYLGRDATKAQLKQSQSPYILHLATHGFVLPDPDLSEIHTLGDSEPTRRGFRLSLSNPMLRSGLALAGAQRTLEAWSKGEAVASETDGILTAEEIGCLNLHNTRLVVLSGCDTGIGQVLSGEGVLGLRRGFVQAGVQNLLMTLWPIDDEQTVELIADFYRAQHETGNPAQALAQVQRTWLHRLRIERGIVEACKVAGPYILSFQGNPTKGLSPNAQ